MERQGPVSGERDRRGTEFSPQNGSHFSLGVRESPPSSAARSGPRFGPGISAAGPTALCEKPPIPNSVGLFILVISMRDCQLALSSRGEAGLTVINTNSRPTNVANTCGGNRAHARRHQATSGGLHNLNNGRDSCEVCDKNFLRDHIHTNKQ